MNNELGVVARWDFNKSVKRRNQFIYSHHKTGSMSYNNKTATLTWRDCDRKTISHSPLISPNGAIPELPTLPVMQDEVIAI